MRDFKYVVAQHAFGIDIVPMGQDARPGGKWWFCQSHEEATALVAAIEHGTARAPDDKQPDIFAVDWPTGPIDDLMTSLKSQMAVKAGFIDQGRITTKGFEQLHRELHEALGENCPTVEEIKEEIEAACDYAEGVRNDDEARESYEVAVRAGLIAARQSSHNQRGGKQ